MLHRPLRLAAASLVALLLAGCQVSIQPIPFDPPIAGTHTAEDSTQPTALRTNVSIAPGDTLYYRIDAGASRDLLYGEAVGDSGLRVRWWSTSGTSLAVSTSPAYFAGTVQALDASTAEVALDPAAIDVQFNCEGPCVAIEPTASTYVLSVYNMTDSSRGFDLYAYTFAANDLEDRGSASNQTAASAVTFSGGTLSGAIELIGDRDWFAYTGSTNRVLEFSVLDPSLGLRLRFEEGTEIAGIPGDQTTNLFPGDRFQVYSVDGRAGPSGASGYFIEIQN